MPRTLVAPRAGHDSRADRPRPVAPRPRGRTCLHRRCRDLRAPSAGLFPTVFYHELFHACVDRRRCLPVRSGRFLRAAQAPVATIQERAETPRRQPMECRGHEMLGDPRRRPEVQYQHQVARWEAPAGAWRLSCARGSLGSRGPDLRFARQRLECRRRDFARKPAVCGISLTHPRAFPARSLRTL